MGDRRTGSAVAAARPLLRHEDRHGGDAVAAAAHHLWTAERTRLGPASDSGRTAEVAELAQIAGWLLFDAGRRGAARRAFADSRTLAVRAGDAPREWFALDMLAMHAVDGHRPDQALAVTEELLTRPRVPPRVALLARVRQARALAQTGERARALTAMHRARGALQDSVAPRDPAWTWWVDGTEVLGHRAEMLLELGAPRAALPLFHALDQRIRSTAPGGRTALHHTVAGLTAHLRAGAWPDAAPLLARTAHLLTDVASTRSTTRLRGTLHALHRQAPTWLHHQAHDTLHAAGLPPARAAPPPAPSGA
ncbi:XRE family transcriptional regulator [Streptomyces qinglanensis]|uniref:XRE family transcriptional regulator n=1 Tax=Streptomyces qinglanensis TaxID=943816 RepID=UPI001112FDBC|nr:XRE family transcriptional regulator [Streptomyces qinglanensis]